MKVDSAYLMRLIAVLLTKNNCKNKRVYVSFVLHINFTEVNIDVSEAQE